MSLFRSAGDMAGTHWGISSLYLSILFKFIQFIKQIFQLIVTLINLKDDWASHTFLFVSPQCEVRVSIVQAKH